uniref:Uncharacterized protein n=1 Tax=Lepeophtheirus salmonis TaxID=72036 RepID=A0A0K2U7Y5_LEPSM
MISINFHSWHVSFFIPYKSHLFSSSSLCFLLSYRECGILYCPRTYSSRHVACSNHVFYSTKILVHILIFYRNQFLKLSTSQGVFISIRKDLRQHYLLKEKSCSFLFIFIILIYSYINCIGYYLL